MWTGGGAWLEEWGGGEERDLVGGEDSPRDREGSLFFNEVEDSTAFSGVIFLLAVELPGAGGFSALTAAFGEWYLKTTAVAAVAAGLLQEAVWGEGEP